MNYQTIITPTTLADHLHKTDWLILDCRRDSSTDSKAYDSYAHQHIPKAFYYADCKYGNNSLLSKIFGVSTSEKDQIYSELKDFGFNLNTQIIIYEELNSSTTNSLWIKLRSLGIPNVAVLQGGFKSWKEQNLPTASINNSNENQMAQCH